MGNTLQALESLIRPFEFAAKGGMNSAAKIKGLHNTISGILSKHSHEIPPTLAEELLTLVPEGFDSLPATERHARLMKGYRIVSNYLSNLSGAAEQASTLSAKTATSVPETTPELAAYNNSQRILSQPVDTLKGVGPKMAQLLHEKNLRTIRDLLFLLPRKYEDRRSVSRISQLRVGMEAYAEGEILAIDKRPRRKFGKKRPQSILVGDGSGTILLTWFMYANNILKRFSKGDRIRFFGKVSQFGNRLQIVHPQIEHAQETEDDAESKIVARYPEVSGINPRVLKRTIQNAVKTYYRHLHSPIPKELVPEILSISLAEAVYSLHFPPDTANIRSLNSHTSAAHKRIAFEQIFFLQLALQWLRSRRRQLSGIAYEDRRELMLRAMDLLDFELTNAQRRVIEEIVSDLLAPHPMNRLLQGDVGSGKTAVALLSSLLPVANGAQVAIMVPTEVLAVQHATNASKMLAPLGVSVDVLISGMKPAQQRDVKQRLRFGDTDIIIGTHALLYSGVEFKRLGMVIIDEQHRFGVEQRAALRQKGTEPDLLVMTATPIPRTLAHAFYGDLDISVLDEMPPGRKPVRTELFSFEQRNSVYARIRKHVQDGLQVYMVYPRIEESEDGYTSATETFNTLGKTHLRGIRLGLLHGRMSTQEKQEVVNRLRNGDIQVLISTTVIEVGIDVPNASVMVIEHADIFGLSQIHQLRGRVGRGGQQGFCYLVTGPNPSETARKRLEIILSTTDGFEIAEADFRLRGPGEYLGAKQSGMPDELLASLIRHSSLIEPAKTAAEKLMMEDPTLQQMRHKALRFELMYHWGERLKLAEAG